MPTYTVTSPEGCLDAEKCGKIAAEITRIHSAATGAPGYFAQVLFTEIKPGHYFIGGAAFTGHQLFVNGQIRAGRSADCKHELITQLAAAVATAVQLKANAVWVYIADLLPQQMVEFGHVLPAPGDEDKWAAALPQADRAHMQSFGSKQR